MSKNPYTWNEAIQKMNLQKLGLTEEEIFEVIEADKAIDKGEHLFSLTPEQEKASKQARQVSREPTAYKFQKRERKEDTDKRTLINSLFDYLEDLDAEIVNPEREILFKFRGKKYKIVLSAPRK